MLEMPLRCRVFISRLAEMKEIDDGVVVAAFDASRGLK